MTSKPDAIVTRHLIRNVLLTALLIVLVTVGVLWWRSLSGRKPAADTATAEETSEPREVQEAEAPYILSVDDAKATITDYYTLLSQNDFSGLRGHGFNEVASAVELGWTRQTGLEIHPEFISPDVQSMPEPVDTYAGNDLYEIGAFFTTVPPADCVKSLVTGATGPIGWIYHDALDGQWHIIDPTVPLATQAPVASNQSRQSNDKLVLVEMSSPGVFRNQWWAMTIFTVSVTSASKTADVSVVPRSFDSGISLEVPDSLTIGISSRDVPIVPTVNPDGSASPLVAKIHGVCTMWRGERQGFDRERIGQKLQQLDGTDMAPVDVTMGAENITPVFPVDNKTAEKTANLLNEEQIKRYGVDGVIVTMPLIDQQSYEQDALGYAAPEQAQDGQGQDGATDADATAATQGQATGVTTEGTDGSAGTTT